MRCGQEQAWDAHSRHGSYTTYCSPPPRPPPPNTIITISTTATTRNKARGMRGSVLNMVGTVVHALAYPSSITSGLPVRRKVTVALATSVPGASPGDVTTFETSLL